VIPAGGHILDCVHLLTARVKGIFTDDAPDYTALRVPLKDEANPDVKVRVPTVISGWPDPGNRTDPLLPFVAVRPPSVRQRREDGEVLRASPIAVVIGVHCEEAADYEYAWVIAERIWQPLCSKPYLGEGLYTIDWANIECSENGELMDSWQAYMLQMTVPVSLPAYQQTEGTNGEKVVWESGWGE
jgi:hypothetical protein